MKSPNITCVYIPPNRIHLVWKDIEPDVMGCVKKGGLGIHTSEFVFKQLLAGNWSLWLVHHWDYRHHVVGFYILNILPKEYAEIVYGHLKPYLDREAAQEVKDHARIQMEQTAAGFGCKKILAYSTRIGMGRLLSDEAGYNKVMSIYCKELENEDPQEDSSDRHGDDRPKSV